MKAVTLRSFSGPEAVVIADVDPPSTRPDDVLVSVEAAAIGPWDLKIVNGAFAALTRQLPLPQVLGWDFAGTVASVGANVTHFAEGDLVLGFSPQIFTGVGAFAEQVAVAASFVAPRPPELSPSQAATVPVCGLTAQKLIDTADLQAGDRVLILGVAGAVGGFAAQLALDANAHVSGTASTADLDVVRARGIHPIDRKTDLETLDEEPFDLVIDLVGAQASQAAIPLVRANGRLISAVPDNVPHPTKDDVEISAIAVQANPAALARLCAAAARGAIPLPKVGAEVALDQARDAFIALEERKLRGKVLLLP
ncbi:MAG: NADP-dependent oxidoreductase [Candidatus Poribacteria bacterium]